MGYLPILLDSTLSNPEFFAERFELNDDYS